MQTRVGRPTVLERRRRERDLVARVTAGERWIDAARAVGMNGDTVLRLLDRPDFRQLAAELLARTVEAAA